MTESVPTITNQKDSTKAGLELGRAIRKGLNEAAADAVIVFASAQHYYERLLGALAKACGTRVIVGSSSAGEFTGTMHGEGYVSALAVRSQSMLFSVGGQAPAKPASMSTS